MGKTICICGNESVLRAHIIRGLAERDYQILITESEQLDEKREPEEKCHYYHISTFTSIRVRSLFMKGIRDFGGIDGVILVHTPGREHSPIHEIPAVTIENAVDSASKGYMYIAKEALSYFIKRKQGALSFVVAEEIETLSSLDAVLAGGFRALADSLFHMYQNEPIIINGYESRGANPELYADFVVRIMTEKEKQPKGRWLHFSDRQGLFQNITIPKLGK